MSNFTRRNFLQYSVVFASFSLLRPAVSEAAEDVRSPSMKVIHKWYLAPDGWVPNNPSLPVLHFRPHSSGQEPATAMLQEAGWSQQWASKPFAYPHFHSGTHAIFVVSEGHGEMRIGGESGRVIHARRGDMLFLPSGSGQQLMSSSNDFAVQAYYPEGKSWDVCQSGVSTETLNTLDNKQVTGKTRSLFNTFGVTV